MQEHHHHDDPHGHHHGDHHGQSPRNPVLPNRLYLGGVFSNGPNEYDIKAYVPTVQLPRAEWPEGKDTFHRFIKNEQEYLFNKAIGYVDKTPQTFRGWRKDGAYEGSYRVMFTLPGYNPQPVFDKGFWRVPPQDNDSNLLRTMELIKSDKIDNPAFGAVEVQLPLSLRVKELNKDNGKRVVVSDVTEGDIKKELFNITKKLATFSLMTPAENDGDEEGNPAMLRRGDIIRAMSMPEPDPSSIPPEQETAMKFGSASGFFNLLPAKAPEPEDGMAMLDDGGVVAYEAALQENIKRNGENAKVVLLIERPVMAVSQPSVGWTGPLSDVFGSKPDAPRQ